MKIPSFTTSAHAKCILSGEHTVIKGGPALILPVFQKKLTLNYQFTNQPLNITIDDDPNKKLCLSIFFKALNNSFDEIHHNIKNMTGAILLTNNIEIGAGIGFSAALCVVITRWLIWEKFLNKHDLYSFAHHLENLFHGNSSGVDIIGSITNHLTHFEISGNIKKVNARWFPKLYITFSGRTKDTTESVSRVNILRIKNSLRSNLIDQEMKESVLMMEKALNEDMKIGIKLFIAAMNQANHCFEQWGLISTELKEHMNLLYEHGALAAKPTGAGNGGYVLSLWDHTPIIEDNSIDFIPL